MKSNAQIKHSLQIDVITKHGHWEEAISDVEDLVRALCSESLERVGFSHFGYEAELAIILTNDDDIRVLNNQYRQIDKPTNVLSFPNELLNPLDFSSIKSHNNYVMLGDIVIALETVGKEAIEQNKLFREHFMHLIIHGLLHLLGFDHEVDQEAEQMEQMEEAILAKFNIQSPYISVVTH